MADAFALVPIAAIRVPCPSARAKLEIPDLADSISKFGLLQPIIVAPRGPSADHELVVGERRLAACRMLGYKSIECRIIDKSSTSAARTLALIENVKRQPLKWPDFVREVAEVHRFEGRRNEFWTQSSTAALLGLKEGLVSMFLRIARDLADPEISRCVSAREAYGLCQKRDSRAEADALQAMLDSPAEADAEWDVCG